MLLPDPRSGCTLNDLEERASSFAMMDAKLLAKLATSKVASLNRLYPHWT